MSDDTAVIITTGSDESESIQEAEKRGFCFLGETAFARHGFGNGRAGHPEDRILEHAR